MKGGIGQIFISQQKIKGIAFETTLIDGSFPLYLNFIYFCPHQSTSINM